MKLPNRNLNWPISWGGVVEIARTESCRLQAYVDPISKGEPITIGWGMTFRADGRKVVLGMTMTQDEADLEFCEILGRFALEVSQALTRTATDNQRAAMVSFAWNVGVAGFKGSSVLKAHNRGDYQAAARAFGLWNKARDPQGKLVEVAGLTARRAREAALYLEPDGAANPLPTPAEVQPESSLAKSPIAQGGVTAAVTGAVTAVAGVNDKLQDMGINPLIVLGVILVVTGGIIVFQRIKQRREGWS